MFEMLSRVARAIARQGNWVILGRGSFAALCGFAEVLNVRIRAPFEFRVNRMMAENAVTEHSQAEAMVHEGDRVRSTFVHSMYGVRWDALASFDFVADIGKIPPEAVAAFIIAVAKELGCAALHARSSGLNAAKYPHTVLRP